MLPVYVLSLAGCEARRAPLLRSLHDLGFEPEVVFGIDGRAGLAPEHEARIDRAMAAQRARRELTDGEFACALSHQAIYSRLLADGHDRAVVLEDDAIVDGRLVQALEDLREVEFDLVLLAHKNARVRRGSDHHLREGSVLWEVVNIPELNIGYVISSSGARKIMHRSIPISYTADWPCDVSGLRTYAVSPQPIARPSTNAGSLIEAGRVISRRSASWGNQMPPYSGTDFKAWLGRMLAKRIN